jgi:putative membrane protein
MAEEVKTSNELAGDRTDLAVKRTAMAASRTMMAWIRTGTSLISFGFAIHKILQTTADAVGTSKLSLFHEHSARRLGLMLIFLGTASIVMGTFEYFSTTKQLNEMNGEGGQRVKLNLSLVVGGLVALLGLFLFVTILANREVL